MANEVVKFNQAYQACRRSQPLRLRTAAPRSDWRPAARSARPTAENSCGAGTQPAPIAFRECSNPRRNRNWATSNRKSGGPRSPPVQCVRPYSSPNLHLILGVPVRRLWK